MLSLSLSETLTIANCMPEKNPRTYRIHESLLLLQFENRGETNLARPGFNWMRFRIAKWRAHDDGGKAPVCTFEKCETPFARSVQSRRYCEVALAFLCNGNERGADKEGQPFIEEGLVYKDTAAKLE